MPIDRILVAELDSQIQRRVYDAQRDDAIARTVGALRSAVVLGGQILVTDAMILDGAILLRLGPEALATNLGDGSGVLPLIRLSSERSLSEALEARLARPDFEWQIRSGTPSWPDEQTFSRWRRWIEFDADGRLPSEPLHRWPDGRPKAPWDLAGRLSGPPPVTAGGGEGIVESLRAATSRSAMTALLARSGLGENERDALASWWNTAYLDAVAAQHGAAWVSFDEAETASTGSLRRSGDLVLPTVLLRELSAMPAGAFAMAAFSARDASRRFRADPSRRRLREVAYILDNVGDSTTWRAAVVGSGARVLLALLAFGFGSLLLPSVESDATLSAVLLGLLALVSVPWHDLAAALKAGRGAGGILSRQGGHD